MGEKQFHLEGFDEAGNRFTVQLAAESQEEAVRKMTLRGFADVRVTGRRKEKRGRAALMTEAQVCRELASMIEAGIALPEALAEAARAAGRGRLAEALRRTGDEVEKGIGLDEALGREGKAFGPGLAPLVRAGQATGDLSDTLKRYAEEAEEQAELSRDVRQALFYPLSVLGMLVVLVTLGVVYLVPTFHQTFVDMLGSKKLADEAIGLFRPTVWVLSLLGAGFLAGCVAWIILSVRRRGSSAAGVGGRLMANAPIVGRMVRKAAQARFYATLAMMVEQGVGVPEALELAGAASGWGELERDSGEASEEVRSGKALSEAVAKGCCGGPGVSWLLATGQRHGKLSESLSELARLSRAEARQVAARIRMLVTPVSVVIVGCAIAALSYGFFMALYGALQLARE